MSLGKKLTMSEFFQNIDYPDSSNTFVRSEKEDKGMSLCFGIAYGNIIYIAADSRSSFVKDTVFGGKRFDKVDTDNYKKIVKIKINTTDVVVCSTGQNKFGENGLSFEETIRKIPIKDDIREYIKDVKERFLAYQIPTQKLDINVVFFENNILNYYKYPSETIITSADDNIKAFWQGVNWAKSVFEYSYFDSHFVSEERTLSQINAVFVKVRKATSIFDKSVGGPVRICRLNPNGFVWLQNGYEL